MTRFDDAGLPLAFVAGLAAAFGGAAIGVHDGGALYHAPHQLLVAVPLALLAAIGLRADPRELWVAAGAAGGGLVVGAGLIAVGG